MKFIKEFKKFALKGNVIDLAVAVIIGGAFGKIVSSLVADIVMPLIGLIMGGVDFTDWHVTLRPEIRNTSDEVAEQALTMNTGIFLQNIVDFVIIALSIFVALRVLIRIKNRFAKKEEEEAAPPSEPSTQEKLLMEIRDLLKEKQ
ncbi:large conductance mechanosensitive channel protein MscL [Candidatus Falkowbacteria bacterium HGW-Falkowbacteria-2]|uniref:Large-conductance mechanosensitive channel n=1 Tax=Candidatus Falkowbacteria bacterium HGW-Falkowbacteria-2 TaxID=2013769 RepID=A0A2N2E3X7_9BACT|nr:MAG: large conductance mechanosensitive channel protein MscL [Candidatus Falkowbacteria bacterium HGW-Falkowbacteria-2]